MATFTEEFSTYLGSNDNRLIYKQGLLSLSGEGADPADIPASLFGLKKLHTVSTNSDTFGTSGALRLVVTGDGEGLFLTDLTQGTDILRGSATDYTTTAPLNITVTGY